MSYLFKLLVSFFVIFMFFSDTPDDSFAAKNQRITSKPKIQEELIYNLNGKSKRLGGVRQVVKINNRLYTRSKYESFTGQPFSEWLKKSWTRWKTEVYQTPKDLGLTQQEFDKIQRKRRPITYKPRFSYPSNKELKQLGLPLN